MLPHYLKIPKNLILVVFKLLCLRYGARISIELIRMANNIMGSIQSTLKNAFPALSVRNYRYFWTGQLVSVMGTWMQSAAQSWLVLTLTDSPFLLGLIGVVQFTPVLLLSLFAGVFIDRFPKKNILIFTQGTSMLLAFILALLVFTGRVEYWHILLLSLGLGIVKTIDIPARQSFMIELVGKNVLLNAIALNSTAFNLARVAGPAVAGFLMALVGAGWCFFINGMSFIAVLIGLLQIKVAPVIRKSSKKNILPDIKEGLKYVFKSKILLRATLILAFYSTFGMNYGVLIPVFARNQLGTGSTGYGFLMSCLGVGAFTGALLIAVSSSKGTKTKRLFFVPLIVSALFIAMGFSHSYSLSAMLVTLIGFSNIFFTTTVNTTMQVNSNDEFRGRVMSVYSLVFAGSTPLGNAFVGSISDKFGVASTFVIAGLITMTSVLGILLFTLKKERSYQKVLAEKR